jgi:hypothetical protein
MHTKLSTSCFSRPDRIDLDVRVHSLLIILIWHCVNIACPVFILVFCLAYSSTLKMEAIFSSETSVFSELHGVTTQEIVPQIQQNSMPVLYSVVIFVRFVTDQ